MRTWILTPVSAPHPPEVMRYIGGATLTREESEAQVSRFERHWEERGFGLWAIKEMASGSLIGFVGLTYHDDWTGGPH